MSDKQNKLTSAKEVKLGKAIEQSKIDIEIIKCPKCYSEIGIDKHTIYPIDCTCGCAIYENGTHKMEYNSVNEHEGL